MDGMNCPYCHKEIPQERVNFLVETERPITCVECSREEGVIGFQVYPHKTGSECVVIRPDDEEALRLADRADKRAR
jgi:NAD-dependent SIR2 family protein deacetylase